ncbi:hypothetical protein MFLAVUS_009849 [Mucor flavus]|uniref:F-box domain-containing protein n=1 Tax=Mucor flavus TaxID=439312 RepID=A0ABP9ZB32_9FUNG
MSTQSHLPSELLEQIFYLLPQKTQGVCLSVCKNWYTTVKPTYFSRISILANTDLSKVLTSVQTTGDLVQSLVIDDNKQVTQEMLIRLVTSCPFLSQLYANPIYFKWVWLGGLELKRLSSVSIVESEYWGVPQSNKHFYRVAYQHRGSIEDLHMPFTHDEELREEFDGIMKYLTGFEKIRRLTLTDGEERLPIYLDTLLNGCKKLEMLEVRLCHPLYPPTTTACEQTRTPYPSLRRLEVFLPTFSDEYLQYIIDRFVNITKLDFIINDSYLHWKRDRQEILNLIHHKYIPFAKTLSESSSLTIYTDDITKNADLAAELFTTFRDIRKVYFEVDQVGSTKIKLQTKQGSTCTDLAFAFSRDMNPDYPIGYIKHLALYGHLIKSLAINSSLPIDVNFFLHNCCNLENLSIRTQQRAPLPQYATTVTVSKPAHHVLYSTLLDITISGGSITPDLIMVKSTCMLDMSSLDSLEKFELDAEHVNENLCRDTCFEIIVPNCRTEYYLTNTFATDLKRLNSYKEIPEEALKYVKEDWFIT